MAMNTAQLFLPRVQVLKGQVGPTHYIQPSSSHDVQGNIGRLAYTSGHSYQCQRTTDGVINMQAMLPPT